MRSAALFVFLFLLMALGLSAQHAVTPADVENGSRLYRANCVVCHGPDGDFIPGVDFGHGKFSRAYSDEDLAHVVINGIPGAGMPAHNFSEQQAELVVSYLRSLAATTGRYTLSGGDAQRGKAIFEGQGQCGTCHRVNGRGSRLGPDLSEIGSIRRAVELEKALTDPDHEIAPENRSYRVVTKSGATVTGRLLNQDTFTLLLMDSNEKLVSFQKPDLREFSFVKKSSMPSYKDRLNSQQLADVVSYLISLKGLKP